MIMMMLTKHTVSNRVKDDDDNDDDYDYYTFVQIFSGWCQGEWNVPIVTFVLGRGSSRVNNITGTYVDEQLLLAFRLQECLHHKPWL